MQIPLALNGMTIMRDVRLFALGLTTAASLTVLTGFPAPSLAQAPAAAPPPQIKALPPKLNCNGVPFAIPFSDPFEGPLALRDLPDPKKVIPVNDQIKTLILNSDLPCQERVSTGLPPTAGPEKEGLENLQRGFDFYSWRTFIALNAPADGRTTIDHSEANMPTRWEDMDNFKQLLDVMLPVGTNPAASWPADKNAMEAEKQRLLPEACRALYKPGKMVVKMIEESFNEPFKTGPLIDQQGHYAIFDILMNRQMFEYIMRNHLDTKAGQKDAVDLAVDFPPGQNLDPRNKDVVADLGAFMLKVSWKILGPEEIKARNFHMVDALVSMPVREGSTAKPPCLPETLGLIGFHAVHKTASRPQWIWTSFEHMQNVPDRNEVNARTFHGPYHFFSINCKDDCPAENATPPREFWQPDLTLKLEFGDTFRSQIVRETPLTDAARHMNDIFHDILKGTVWVNYMLLSTQWPSNFGCTFLHSQSPLAPKTDFLKQPDMTCSPAPTYFANSTLETYSQGEVPMASSSCIACHGNAVSFQTNASNQKPGGPPFNQSDFTFILEKAQ
jgi:hypothetical protein